MRPAHRRALAEKAVATRDVSIALACRAFEVSETCYRYNPRLDDENEQIADLLLGLTTAKKTWGFGLCFELAPISPLYCDAAPGHHFKQLKNIDISIVDGRGDLSVSVPGRQRDDRLPSLD